MTNEVLERQVIELVAADRLFIPVSSMDNKLKRRREKMAEAIELLGSNLYRGDRIYARTEEKDKMKARTMKEAIATFSEQYPTHGKVLQGMIAEKRLQKEKHLYFGVRDGCRLTCNDYIEVMKDLGFGPVSANSLYHELIEVTRNLSRKRAEGERSILVGKVIESEE
ncbi:MAG TPA: hypothetical protein VJ438_01185 [Candidatus Nanoarchaeia archaeon]|nr:hypothetical protein [Candidatus Nanoarchaeia archaeon]